MIPEKIVSPEDISDAMEAELLRRINEVRNKFKHFVESVDNNDIFGYMINSYIHFNNFDDLFEGNNERERILIFEII